MINKKSEWFDLRRSYKIKKHLTQGLKKMALNTMHPSWPRSSETWFCVQYLDEI